MARLDSYGSRSNEWEDEEMDTVRRRLIRHLHCFAYGSPRVFASLINDWLKFRRKIIANEERERRFEQKTMFLLLFRKKNFQNQITVSLICNHFDRIIFVLILFRATLSFLRFILIEVDLFDRT